MFLSQNGRKLTVVALENIVRKAGELAKVRGISESVHIHADTIMHKAS